MQQELSRSAWIIAGAYRVVCDSLNARSKLSLCESVFDNCSRGERIYGIAADLWQKMDMLSILCSLGGVTHYVASGSTGWE